MNKKFIEIDNVLINQDIAETKFTCDLSKCKGACCTMESEFGAPVEEKEIETIKKYLPQIMELLPEAAKAKINKEGFWEDIDGELLIKSVNNRDCVFVYYEGDIAKCAMEKLYFNNEIDFRKPISCHLFPIRISDFGGPVLRYERYRDCEPAVKKGNEENVTTLDFCEDSLTRKYGKEWFKKVKQETGS